MLALAGGLPAPASAAVGAINPAGCIVDITPFSHDACATQMQGLDGVEALAVSPDGRSVYAAGSYEDTLLSFNRNTTTGALTPAGCISDVHFAAVCASQAYGLDHPTAIAVSPDGASVYVVSHNDGAIVRFDRDTTTGALQNRGCIVDPNAKATPDPCARQADGLDGAEDVVISPDGSSIYVAAEEDSGVVRLRRTATGAMSVAGCVGDDDFGLPGCAQHTIGLGGVRTLAISPDGTSLYAGSEFDDAIVRFERNPTGSLGYRGCTGDNDEATNPDDCPQVTNGLDRVIALTISPDGRSLYAAAEFEDALVRFDRKLAGGALTPRGCVIDNDATAGEPCAQETDGLRTPVDIAVSPDGASVYVTGELDNAVARFDRATSGALTPRGCVVDQVPSPAESCESSRWVWTRHGRWWSVPTTDRST